MGDVDRLRLLASALAGRSLDVATAAPGDGTWTDGEVIYIDALATPQQRLRALVVQTSLIAAGSLDQTAMRQLARRPSRARAYLETEGRRALEYNSELVPPLAGSLHDPREFGALYPRRVLAALRGAAPVPPALSTRPLPELAADGDTGNLGDLLSSPVGGGGPIGRLLQRLFRPARGRGRGTPGADAPTHATDGLGSSDRSAPAARAAGSLDPDHKVATTGATYPEWDVFRGRYRADWCTVVESTAPAGEATPKLAEIVALRRSLARLGVGLTPVRRRADGEDIDLDAAIEAHVDRRAGVEPTRNTYVESVRRRRDLSVLVLLDVSGSAAEAGAAGLSVHTHQQRAAAALVTALNDLGDRVSLYAFNSRGRAAVQLARVKDFDHPFDADASRRLAALSPAAYTRLGAAIRHATTVLDTRGGTPRRLLVVLSDGFAYDHGYEGRYGEADARRALSEARRRGVGCLCLSVGANADTDALLRVFGAAAHASIPRVEDLPAMIGPLFRDALEVAG